jgi:NAD(P)-dependent dehydrogenase (short-subunit alcohol dehydrogenase family)
MSKVFFLTGSARGLGRNIAEAVLSGGHRLVASARRPEQLDDLVARYGERIKPVAVDVTDAAAVEAAVKVAVDTFGRLDVVVNNAGYANLASVEDSTLEDFRAQIDANFFGVVTVTKAALPILRAQGNGHIIQISSIGGRLASVGLSAYQAAKWAVGGFSEVLAQEVAPLGLKVTIVEPGGMQTDWAGSSMSIPEISAPYQQTVGHRASLLGENFAPVGDPAKVAQVVMKLVDLQEPPLRLILGSDAFRYAEQSAQARARADAQWRELSVSTDRDNVAESDLDPLGRVPQK